MTRRPRTRSTGLAPRRLRCSVLVAILAATAGIAPVPEESARFPVMPMSTTAPDNINGTPIDEAPPRVTVRVGPELLAASGASLAEAHGDLRSDGPDAGQVHTRALGAEGPSISTDRLSASNRELLEAAGVIEVSSDDRQERTTAESSVPPSEAPAPPREPPAWTTSTGRAAQADLEAYLVEQTGIEVQASYVVGDRFAIVGTEVEDLQGVEGLTDVFPEPLAVPMRIPEDPNFSAQWSLANTGQILGGVAGRVGADMDWVAVRGLDGSGVVVAVVEPAFDLTHRDLATSWHENPHETCGGTHDADGNGYPGNGRGWNFCREEAGLADPWDVHDPTVEAVHGTHVARIIAAARDGTGTVGVAPGVTIVPLTVFPNVTSAVGFSLVARASVYAVDNGADIINLSLGSAPRTGLRQHQDPCPNLVLAMNCARHHDVVVVAAAGNSAQDIDEFPSYPAALDHPNLLTVAALDHRAAERASRTTAQRRSMLPLPAIVCWHRTP